MEVTPACYAHLITPLMSLAQGRIAVILEGGYCLESLAESAAITLKTLLGDPCPKIPSISKLQETIPDSILNCIYSHKPYWNCLKVHRAYNLEDLNNVNPQPDLHKVIQKFIDGEPRPERFETRDCYPVQSDAESKKIARQLGLLKITTNLNFPENRVCYVYDMQMTEHQNVFQE